MINTNLSKNLENKNLCTVKQDNIKIKINIITDETIPKEKRHRLIFLVKRLEETNVPTQ